MAAAADSVPSSVAPTVTSPAQASSPMAGQRSTIKVSDTVGDPLEIPRDKATPKEFDSKDAKWGAGEARLKRGRLRKRTQKGSRWQTREFFVWGEGLCWYKPGRKRASGLIPLLKISRVVDVGTKNHPGRFNIVSSSRLLELDAVCAKDKAAWMSSITHNLSRRLHPSCPPGGAAAVPLSMKSAPGTSTNSSSRTPPPRTTPSKTNHPLVPSTSSSGTKPLAATKPRPLIIDEKSHNDSSKFLLPSTVKSPCRSACCPSPQPRISAATTGCLSSRSVDLQGAGAGAAKRENNNKKKKPAIDVDVGCARTSPAQPSRRSNGFRRPAHSAHTTPMASPRSKPWRVRELNYAPPRESMSFREYQKVAQTGDLMLFRTTGVRAGLTRALTWARMDHVGLVVVSKFGDVRVLEALQGSGVIINELHSFKVYKWCDQYTSTLVRQLRPPLGEEQKRRIAQFAEEVRGRKYSLLNVVRS
eukprot:CAMPEP_0167817358 /NCGR_PEP_ID=MMETSP0112_2-20121227/4141_1 /TAXON_ID=91324 /ORGANISM="Lotharella globosa, Strain CCCM811" /LENGTH=471 /DNA_ID=CAMNT_0007717095 /DNA_START=42 /DNA_END=1453 /DNA_ORIENTATION=-